MQRLGVAKNIAPFPPQHAANVADRPAGEARRHVASTVSQEDSENLHARPSGSPGGHLQEARLDLNEVKQMRMARLDLQEAISNQNMQLRVARADLQVVDPSHMYI